MKLPRLLLYIVLTTFVFWLLDNVLKITVGIIDIILVIGFTLVIASFVYEYWQGKQKH